MPPATPKPGVSLALNPGLIPATATRLVSRLANATNAVSFPRLADATNAVSFPRLVDATNMVGIHQTNQRD